MVVSLHDGVEAVVTAAEVAGKAWEAVERRRHDREHIGQEVAAAYQECVEAEGALAHERAENERLRGIVELYHSILADGQNFESSAFVSFPPWGGDRAELLDQLRRKVESPSFLTKLEAIKASSSAGIEDGGPLTSPVDEQSDWLLVSEDGAVVGETKEEQDNLGASGYCVVTQDDIVDGIANCVATYIISIPQAQRMSPQDLQETLAKAFTTSQKKGRLRKIWDASKVCYTLASWGATIVGVYQHPLVIRAAAVSAWTSYQLIARIVK